MWLSTIYTHTHAQANVPMKHRLHLSLPQTEAGIGGGETPGVWTAGEEFTVCAPLRSVHWEQGVFTCLSESAWGALGN